MDDNLEKVITSPESLVLRLLGRLFGSGGLFFGLLPVCFTGLFPFLSLLPLLEQVVAGLKVIRHKRLDNRPVEHLPLLVRLPLEDGKLLERSICWKNGKKECKLDFLFPK